MSLNRTSMCCVIFSHVERNDLQLNLTGDCSAEGECAEIDDRVKLAVETGDEDLILDLRHLNKGRPGDTFQVFFSELEKIVDETTAADERRHGISHMSEFLSICDLIQRVKGRVPNETPIPSEATVLYAFAPPNIHKSSSQYYTGKDQLETCHPKTTVASLPFRCTLVQCSISLHERNGNHVST